jgi:hypothetical protein
MNLTAYFIVLPAMIGICWLLVFIFNYIFPTKTKKLDNKELLHYEKLLMEEYITPLSNYKGSSSTRKISDIGNIEKIENYYDKYTTLYKKFHQDKAKQLSDIVYKSSELNYYSKENHDVFFKRYGNAYLIFGNYHCLATYVEDEVWAKLTCIESEFKVAYENGEKEKLIRIMKLQSDDKDYQYEDDRCLDLFNRQNLMKAWLAS